MKCARHVIWGSLLLLAAGVLMHFSFDWLGRWHPLGALFPVNESVFEHLKLIFYPMVVYWIFAAPNRSKLPGPLAAGVIVAIFSVLSLFYILKGGFGIESLAVDIVIQAISLALGQAVVCALLCREGKLQRATSILLGTPLILIAMMLIVFTFDPPKLPLFRDAPTGGYGIDKQIDKQAGIDTSMQNF